MEDYNHFTNLYSRSLTLRFEAKPVGKTEENFRRNFLQKDKDRAEKYKEAKLIIDNYHRWHIETVLKRISLDEKKLLKFYEIYSDKDYKEREKSLSSLQKDFRETISKELLKNKKELFGEELVTSLLPQWLELNGDKEALAIISEFDKFTTYFKGFNINRENIYTDKKKKNSITYRLIHENLLKFIDNINLFKRISQTDIANNFEKIKQEHNLDVSLEDIFTIAYFNQILPQSGIDRFNLVIGGHSSQDRVKYKGLNEYINEYNQTHPGCHLPKFRPLFKQILSEKESASLHDIQFTSSSDVIASINQAYHTINKHVLSQISNVLRLITVESLPFIYIQNDTDVTRISNELLGSFDYIKRYFVGKYEQIIPCSKKLSREKYLEKINKAWDKNEFLTLEYINIVLCQANKEDIISYFTGARLISYINNIRAAYDKCRIILEKEYSGDLKSDKESTSIIKELLDRIKDLQLFLKPLSKGEFQLQKADNFYNEFIPLYSILDNNISRLYDRVRNYVTQKPYSTDKVKLNFENSTLMNGWDINKECANTTIILRKDDAYYIGIMDKKHNKCFCGDSIPSEGVCYEKMDYKQISMTTGVGGFIRKCFKTAQNCGWTCPDTCLNSEGKIIIKDDDVRNNLAEIIDCQKDFFEKYEKDGFKYKNYEFKFRPSEDYERLSDFYKDVKEQGYKITFRNISKSYIDKLVADGKLYLFRLHNKDFSSYSKGLPNLHTLYWKMLFDKENLRNVMYVLNGDAELFFRPASIEGKITHPANVPIPCKSVENKGQDRTFKYNLIKDKRYAVDKFQFHVPITLNFKEKGVKSLSDFNEYINKYYLPQTTHIIGIDRGERHLLYISVIDMNGNIVKQFTLNEIINEYNGKQYSTDYHKKLEIRENERAKARESWQSIENIKELKEGYLSQVVHKIVQLVLEYNAVIVMENLEKGFKNNRLKIEKSVYQKFEDALINKLSYIVDKTKAKTDVCGLLNALQLAYIPKSKSDITNQCGIIFYIPAWCTSKIDPVTGFVSKINTQYTNKESARELIDKFADIRYNADNQFFEFHIDNYMKFGGIEGTRKDWILTSRGSRIETIQNPITKRFSEQVEVNLTDEFMAILKDGIEGNLKDYILQQDNSQFFKDLLRCIKLMLQMRNSKAGTNIDYLISPVMQEDGSFFNSNDRNLLLPIDADANGAFNIARKGLLVINNVNNGKKDAFKIDNKTWLNFVQQCNV